MHSILEASMEDSWTPGQQRMTIDDHYDVAKRFLNKAIENQIAVTLDEKSS
jgi:hypothetical protein